MLLLLALVGCWDSCQPIHHDPKDPQIDGIPVDPDYNGEVSQIMAGTGVDEDGGILNCTPKSVDKDCYVPLKVVPNWKYRRWCS